MTNVFTKTITALVFAGIAVTATAQAETANHMTGDTMDFNSHITSMTEATGTILEVAVTNATDAIVLAETARLTDSAPTQRDQFAASAMTAPAVQIAYGDAPAFFLVPIAD